MKKRMLTMEKPMGWCAMAVLSILVFLIFYGENGYWDQRALRFRNEAIMLENQKIDAENREIERKIHRLKTDLGYIEHIARHDLGMLAEDELILRFQGQKKSTQ